MSPALEELLDNFSAALAENQQKAGKKEMLSESLTQLLGVYFHTLAVVFKSNAIPADQTEFELKKDDFLIILKDLGMLDSEKLSTDRIHDMMKEAFRIPHESLLYEEMLEVLLDVTLAFPFSEESMGTSREAKKMMRVLDKLQATKVQDAEKFKADIEEARKLKSYVLRYLIPEQESLNVSQRPAGEEEAKGEEEEEDFEEPERTGN